MAIGQTEAGQPALTLVSPVGQAEQAVQDAAGKAARPEVTARQGFELDQEAKVAVEAHAMSMATEFYSAAWTVEDVHGTGSCDLVCK